MADLATGCAERNYSFFVIGDQPSPDNFHIDGCDFYGLERQLELDSKYARSCPTRHYCRKNIGYLLSIRNGSSMIIETDDDNLPYENFWQPHQRIQDTAVVETGGWVNVYHYFSKANIWPRGFPLSLLQKPLPAFETLNEVKADCPIQQGLADDNPDVDAVYRLILPLPQKFDKDRSVALGRGCWCPFNSQNTTWWADAFALLYLPAYCSFRMTDIWRSFVAQRICWENGWSILFTSPTMWQERNEHNLMRDFEDELPGYLHNTDIRDALEGLVLEPSIDKIGDNLRICYEKLVSMSLIGRQELELLDAWLDDISD
ncbi:MAG: STELLO glycosyltransferase family protein [Planctomycetota bacterium]